MKRLFTFSLIFLFLLLKVLLFLGWCVVVSFDRLKRKLIADGFDRKIIEKFYNNPQVKFLPATIKTYVMYRESKLNYKQFLHTRFVLMGQTYLKQYQETFYKAYKQYGVEPSVIVSILIVETKLGTYTGKYSVFNVLSSLALMGMKNSFLMNLTEKDIKRLKKRAKWAYKELKAFLQYVIKYNIDPFSIKGSFAGAFGIPQFVPTSLWKFGQDGNDDGVIDLYNHHDAIMSVAYYLSSNGWRQNLDKENKKKILFRYNHSSYYVNTILRLAEMLKPTIYYSSTSLSR